MSVRQLVSSLVLCFVLCVGGCAEVDGERRDEVGAPGGAGASGLSADVDAEDIPGAIDMPAVPVQPAPPGCGDGDLTENEACDDGNRLDGDGCLGNCLGVDPGFTCPVVGELCRPFARCGDAVVAFPEQCDDGAREPGDGCSSNCKIELGFDCDASGGTGSCAATTCGDGVIAGAETCDDGNGLPLDGCSADCIAEPDCSGGACESSCGDGLKVGLDEACDDGNTLAGDGCAPDCTVEAGYICSQETDCERGPSGECVLRVPAVFRDFGYAHSDFEETSCGGSTVTPGLVQDTLVAGKPVGTTGAVCTTALDEWFVDLPGTNVTHLSEILLYDNGQGGYVNRYGDGGERWVTEVGWNCMQPGAMCAYDGNPFFFPVDGIPGALDDGGSPAAVSTTEYGMDGTTYSELTATGMAGLHNFSFTSEVTYWFQFEQGMNARLEFIGDDDVWVFVNGRLAVDLGGLHQAIRGQVTLSDANAGAFDLQVGGVYEIKVFQAERKSQGSTFKLTLSGFSTARSDCLAECGDGLVGAGEECDDGVNDGGYNECQEGCVLGPYCGDGMVQEGEDCDDGNRADGDDCGSACRNIVLI